MSSPYVYSPNTGYNQQLPNAYSGGGYAPQPSPFIPDTNIYPSSPYVSPYRGPSVLSNSDVNFPGAAPGPGLSTENYATWSLPPRERRISWNGGGAAPLPTPPSPYLGASQPPANLYSQRRNSWGQQGGDSAPFYVQPQNWSNYIGQQQSMSPYVSMSSQPPPNMFLTHPYINGDAPRYDFWFDLSSLTFTPMRIVGPGNQSVLLGTTELQEAATHPPVTRLRIVSDMLPLWPIDLEFNPQGYGGGPAPPISLGDVLFAIYHRMQERISHHEWARLDGSMEHAVAKTYGKRCKRAGPSMQASEQANGVKKVDFLLGKSRMVGLVRVGDSYSTMKLITTSL